MSSRRDALASCLELRAEICAEGSLWASSVSKVSDHSRDATGLKTKKKVQHGVRGLTDIAQDRLDTIHLSHGRSVIYRILPCQLLGWHGQWYSKMISSLEVAKIYQEMNSVRGSIAVDIEQLSGLKEHHVMPNSRYSVRARDQDTWRTERCSGEHRVLPSYLDIWYVIGMELSLYSSWPDHLFIHIWLASLSTPPAVRPHHWPRRTAGPQQKLLDSEGCD